MTTPQLGIRELEASQSQPEVIVNEALRILEAAIQIRVLDKDLLTPPVTPVASARYLLAGTPLAGVWIGHGNQIAYLRGSSWAYLTPQEGWLCWVDDENSYYQYLSGAWVEFSAGGSITIVNMDVSPPEEIQDVTELQLTGATITNLGGGVIGVSFSGGGAAPGHGTQTAIDITAGAAQMNHALGADFTLLLDENVTAFTHAGVTNGETNWFSMRVTQDGTGGRTFAPPASWIYPSGVSAYAASTGAGDVDLVQGVSYNDGTTWLISYEKDYA
jgi:hypothetical protein